MGAPRSEPVVNILEQLEFRDSTAIVNLAYSGEIVCSMSDGSSDMHFYFELQGQRYHEKKALDNPDVTSRFNNIALNPMFMTPEQFAARIKADYDKSAKLIAVTGVKVN